MPTARLWKQLGAPHPLRPVGPTSDSVLGDWALKSTDVQQGRFFVAVNERTLMAVVFAERPVAMVPHLLATCVAAQLEVFGIPRERILAEATSLESATFGKNRARPLLGILNEVSFQFEAYASGSTIASPGELLEIQTRLNHSPHRAGSQSCVFAQDAIASLLGSGTLH